MQSSAVIFACLAGLLILGLLSLGLFMAFRPPKAEIPADPSPSPSPKKRGLLSRPIDWIALIFLVAVGGCVVNGIINGGSNPGGGPLTGKHQIVYRISGTARSASITYYNAQGGTEQQDISVPWEIKFDMDYYDFATISAQKDGEGGTITCEIFDNGRQWLTSTSSAAYGIASCGGLVGQK